MERLKEFDPKGVEEHLRQAREREKPEDEIEHPDEGKQPKKRKRDREER